jgi:hypothetical protein
MWSMFCRLFYSPKTLRGDYAAKAWLMLFDAPLGNAGHETSEKHRGDRWMTAERP